MIGGRAADLARVKLAHPLWMVRRLADPDSEGYRYAASRAGFADISDSTPGGLSGQLSRAERHGPRQEVAVRCSEAIALAAVRAHRLLAERHEPLVMTPGDLRLLLGRYQQALSELAEAMQPYAPMQADPDQDTAPLPGQRTGPEPGPAG